MDPISSLNNMEEKSLEILAKLPISWLPISWFLYFLDLCSNIKDVRMTLGIKYNILWLKLHIFYVESTILCLGHLCFETWPCIQSQGQENTCY